MTHSISRRIISASWLLTATLFPALLNRAAPPDPSRESGVEFRIMTHKLVYEPGSMLLVKFIIANTGEKPLLISRSISQCSNVEGSFLLSILDPKNHDVTGQGCSADVAPTWEIHVMEQVSDPKLWIVLEPGEIYGKVSTFKLPRGRGIYQLRAELIPSGLTDEQREILSQRQIRVLRSPCPAPVVTINIR